MIMSCKSKAGTSLSPVAGEVDDFLEESGLRVVSKDFFSRDTVLVAREILGKVLVKKSPGGWAGGTIVEAEAYLGEGDPACHAARGMTPRNRVMFGPPGQAYVYFIYGMYNCFNCVAFDPRRQKAGAVLIRALEPLWGLDLMSRRRNRQKKLDLTSGPGKLCSALSIDRGDNGKPLWDGDLLVCHGNCEAKISVTGDTRIGIKTGCDLKLRFYLEGNPHISRVKPGKAR